MATSGDIILLKNYHMGSLVHNYYLFSWSRTAYSAESNTSTIRWGLNFCGWTDGSAVTVTIPKTLALTIDGVSYSANLPTGMYSGSNNIASGTITIEHNIDGSKAVVVDLEETGINTREDAASFELDTIERFADIYRATNFTDEENPTISYYNPAGSAIESLQACISFTGGKDDVPYRDIPVNGTSYTFNLTTEERNALRNALPTSNSSLVRFYVRSTINGETRWEYVTGIFTIVNSAPIISPSIYDTNGRVTAITGDDSTFIQHASTIAFNSGAQAQKGAYIVSQYVTCGTQKITDVSSGTLDTLDGNAMYFSVTDSRNNTTTMNVPLTVYPYVPLTSSLTTEPLGSDGNLICTVKGKYYDGWLGSMNNSMEIEYALSEYGGDITWYRLGHVTPNTSGTDYTYTFLIEGLNWESQYELTVNVIDELTPVQQSTTVIQAIPVYDWGRNDFHHHTDVYFEKDIYMNNQPLDYIVEQGTYGNWYYRKWNSGRVELTGTQAISNLPCTATLGNWYRTAVQSAPDFPFAIINPRVTVNYESAGYGALVWPTTETNTGQPFDYYLIRPTSSSGITGKMIFHVDGAWKGVG